MSLHLYTLIGNETFETVTIPIFEKCNSAMLQAFYKLHMHNNLMKNVVYSTKESIEYVMTGIVYHKTNGPVLLSLSHSIINRPIIGDVPVLPSVEQSILFVKPPHVIKFDT